MLVMHLFLHEGAGFQSHEYVCQMLDMAPREEEVIEYGFTLEEQHPNPSPNHQDQMIDTYLEDCAEK